MDVNQNDLEWAARVERRQKALGRMKSTPEYAKALSLGKEMPPEPEPLDRTLSKRAWEKALFAFVHALRSMIRDM